MSAKKGRFPQELARSVPIPSAEKRDPDMQFMKKPPRVQLLDEIRGLCILLMVAYHIAFDLVFLFDVNIPAFHWPLLAFLQPLVAGIFIFISGIACRYSRSNLKRGLQALGIGVGISFVTAWFMPEQMIWFGILHFLGVCMLLFVLVRPLLDRISVFAGLLGCAALFAVTVGVPNGYLFGRAVALPQWLYTVPGLFPLGFGGSGADYFPLLPWAFVFFAGAYMGTMFVQSNMPAAFYRPHVKWLAAVGRHTLVIYVLHQPVAYGLLLLLFRVIR